MSALAAGFRINGDWDNAGNNFDYSKDDDPNKNQKWLKNNDEKLSQSSKFKPGNKADSKNFLKNNENNSSKMFGKNADKNNSLREKEGNVEADVNEKSSLESQYKNSVEGVKKLARGDLKGAKAALKKGGPVLAIILVLVLFVAIISISQLSAPLNFVSQIRENFDSVSISQTIRSKIFLKFQLSGSRNKNCIKAHYFRTNKFDLSDLQRSKLSKSNITVSDDNTRIYYHRTGGETVEIVADKKLKTDSNVTFDEFYAKDSDFHNNYNNATRRWKGSAAWYDSPMPRLLEKIGLKSRDQYKTFNADSENPTEDMKAVVREDADIDGVHSKTQGSDYDDIEEYTSDENGNKVPKTDDNGNPITHHEVDQTHKGDIKENTISSSDDVKPTADGQVATSKTQPTVAGKLWNIAESAMSASQLVTNFYCAFADGVGAITAAIAAVQVLQVINLASDIFEGIQKSQVAEDGTSPYLQIAETLSKPVTTTYTDVQGLRESDDDPDVFVADEDQTKISEITGSAFDAEGVARVYDGKTVNPDDPSVKSFNIKNVAGNIWKSIGNNNSLVGKIGTAIGNAATNISFSKDAFRSCTVARLGNAWLSLAVSTIRLVKDVGQCVESRVMCIVNAGKRLVEKFSQRVFKSLVVSTIVNFLLPHVINMLTRKVAKDVAGVDLGNGLVDGANAYMLRNHLYSGGSIADKLSLTAYYQQQDAVIADNARYERETKSPFDASSKYTFLGSLMTQLIPLSSQMSSLTGFVKGISSTAGSAFASLMPKSSAVSAGIRAQAEKDMTEISNPDLADIGGVGDAFGNPYVITDTKTLDLDPADVVNEISDQLEDVDDESAENVPTIKENSKLAKYIYYCGQRQSPFGMADQNIATEVDEISSALSADEDDSKATKVGKEVAQATLNSIGIVNDFLDIVNNDKKLANLGWITGQACVTGNEIVQEAVVDRDTPSWEEVQYYQRFIEDQRLAETSGVIEKSAVTELLAKYYEKHPIDYSYEGIVARYSGLTKDNVILAFDLLDVANFIADYHPAEMYPYPVEEESDEEPIELEHHYYEFSNDAIALHDVIFENNRYRNFAA